MRTCGAAKGSKWVPLWSVLGQTRYQTPHPNSTLFGQCMTEVWWRVGSGAGKTAVAVCGHVTRKPLKTTPPQSIMQQRCKRHSQTACTHQHRNVTPFTAVTVGADVTYMEGIIEVLPLKGVAASPSGNSAISEAFLDDCAERWKKTHWQGRLAAKKEAEGVSLRP